MSVRILPVNPDLDQLRRQAKELKRTAAAGDPESLQRLRIVGDEVSLATAQLALAREYGFSSWRRLGNEVHRLRAIASGDVAGLTDLLRAEPTLAQEPVRSRFADQLTPLDYVGQGRLHSAWKHDRAGELSRVILDAGTVSAADSSAATTALITAASYPEPAMVRALIDAGADLEVTGNAAPGSGTALAHAVHYGNVEAVDLLIAAGAVVHDRVEAAGAGRSDGFGTGDPALALRAAAVCERLEVIDALLAGGVDVNAEFSTLTEPRGATALHSAAHEGKVAAVRHLLARGADPELRVAGSTALDRCRRRHREMGEGWGHAEVEAILEPLAAS